MIRTLGKILAIGILPFFLMGFSLGGNKPTENDLKNSLSLSVPSFVKVTQFTIEVMENQGTNVEPRYRARFRATIEASDDLCKPDKKENDILFVLLQTPRGKRTDIFGKTTSILYQGKWKHSIEIDGNPIENLGVPLNQIPGGRRIVRGSNEENSYNSEIKRKKDEFRNNLANANKLIIGSWRDENSICTRRQDGTDTCIFDNGREIIFEWSINSDILESKQIKLRDSSSDNWRDGNKKIVRYKIISIDENNFTIEEMNYRERYNAKRVK